MADNIRVVVRVRPLLKFQDEPAWMLRQNSLIALQGHQKKSNYLKDSILASKSQRETDYVFNFEGVVAESVTSEQLYKKQVRPSLLECFNSRKNLAVMAYGQTCSGKTHTILGVKQQPGILPCVLRELFLLKQTRTCSIKVSYLEIYNERLSDLLNSQKREPLKIIQDSKWGCDVAEVTRESVASFEEAISLLERGEKQRQYGQGEHHDRSSRSHTLFKIFIEEWDSNLLAKSFAVTVADLAGSERMHLQTQTVSETGYINKSLFQLTNVISKLADQSKHIPFRDSKLTRLLESSLTGRGCSLLICCVSPSSKCFNETLSTLRLAQRAKHVQLKQEATDQTSEEIEQLKNALRLKERECANLRRELQQTRAQLKQIQQKLSSTVPLSGTDLKGDLLILLDHENFSVFLSGRLQSFPGMGSIGQELMGEMQRIYEGYAREVVRHCYGERFELQVEEVCFMNLVLEEGRIRRYRIEVIEELLRGREAENDKFYVALEGYRDKLLGEVGDGEGSETKRELRKDYKSLRETSINHLSSQKLSVHQSPSLQLDETKQIEEQFGSELLVWGSRKDYRVCKGMSSELNMIRISSLGSIRAVVCGYHHTLVVTREGKLFGWGKNTDKQILPLNRESVASPTEILGVGTVRTVAAGWGHSLAVTEEGQLYAWGFGADGQLGLGAESRKSPTVIAHPNSIVSVYAGHSHSAFIDSAKDAYFFGFNSDYRLMIGDEKTVVTPKRVTIRDVVSASLGVSHSALITVGGSLYCGGVGTYGQLGVVLDESMTGWEKLEVVDRRFQQETFEKICPLVQVQGFGRSKMAVRVGCGENTTVVLDAKGQVYSFGRSVGGRTGHSKPVPSKILQGVDQIDSRCRHSLALQRSENKLYSWGFNIYGQANPSLPGDVDQPQLIQLPPSTQIIGLSCGFFHSALLLK